MDEHDAIVVSARCAGSALANLLAQRGCDVALVDLRGGDAGRMAVRSWAP